MPQNYLQYAFFSASCYIAHSLLSLHYADVCRGGWLASMLAVEASPYCAFVRKGLGVLQWSPLGALMALPAPSGLLGGGSGGGGGGGGLFRAGFPSGSGGD